MIKQLGIEDARESLNSHVDLKARQIREKYGPQFGWNELMTLLEDTEFVRYPCQIVFDEKPLIEGEFACAMARGDNPLDGYAIHVHPFFATQLSRVVWMVLYHLVVVNYGDFASAEDAETFGAGVLGISRDQYYEELCQLADSITWEAPACPL